jgi:pimeloyl-ACP methyl ester carboxylesterase
MSAARKALAAVGALALAALLTSAMPLSANAEPSGDVAPWHGATDTSASGATCDDYMFSVALASGRPKDQRIFGRLCYTGSLAGKTLQILLPGGTYDHTYWDFPFQPDNYNYVRSASAAGYATLNLDRVGYGYSSRPSPLETSFDKQGYTVHQVVQQVRTGVLGDFHKVVLTGHSMGSFTAWDEAGVYKDVDGVIITGAEHNANTYLWTNVIPPLLWPVQIDAKFADKGLPVGYLTTRPGTRCGFLYYHDNVDPQVCNVDEQLKDIVTAAEGASFPPAIITNSALAQQINVPVLMVDGQYDYFYCSKDCNDRTTEEAKSYSGSPCYESYILPDTGHDANLHRNARTWFDKANDWLGRRIGQSAQAPATEPCG